MKKIFWLAAVATLSISGVAAAQESLTEISDLYMVGWQTSWSAFELIKSSDHVFFYQGKVEGGDGDTNGSFRASPLGGDAVFSGPQVHAVEDKTLLSPTTSITEIIQDGGNVTCEYFNLQGIRVTNPVVGEVYIQRSGATVKKVIIR